MKRLGLLALLVTMPGLVLAVDVDGQVAWSQRIEMSTPVSGVVDEVLVNVGDRVEKNDVLLRLQPHRFKSALSSSTAAKKDALYKLKEAEREWDRSQELYERTVLADRDLQLAENDLVAAKAVYAKAEAHYNSTKLDMAESVMRAPFAAVVLERHAQPGQSVVTRLQTVPLVTLAATTHYHATGSVSASDANQLASGQAVAVTVNGQRYNGILSSVGFEPVKDTGSYPVIVRFTTGGSLLRAGQAATLHLP